MYPRHDSIPTIVLSGYRAQTAGSRYQFTSQRQKRSAGWFQIGQPLSIRMPSEHNCVIPMDASGVELRFHDEMLEIYRRAKVECHYNATRFLQMVSETGGLAAARSLLAASGLSDGVTALWQCGRLDLTMEALVLRSPWKDLFTDAELAIAQKRLDDLGYVPR